MLNEKTQCADWIEKENPSIWCLHETQFRAKDTHRLKVRGWKNIFHENGNNNKLGSITYIKVVFKTKSITKRQRWALYNNKRINKRRGYNIHYHIYI